MFVSVQHLNYAWVEKIYYKKKEGENETDRQTNRQMDGWTDERENINESLFIYGYISRLRYYYMYLIIRLVN